MRERQQGGSTTPAPVIYNYWRNPGNSRTNVNGERSASYIPFEKVTRDVVTVGYHDLVKQGKILPVNPFYTASVFESHKPGFFAWHTERANPAYTGIPTLDHSISGYITAAQRGSVLAKIPSVDPPSEADVKTKALVKINTQALDVGTFAAEFGKTIRMVTNFKQSLRRLIKALFRHTRKKGLSWYDAAGYLNALSSAWLEIRYGWRILYYDMQAIASSINALEDQLLPIERTSAYIADEETYTIDGDYFPGIIPGVGDVGVSLSYGKAYRRRSVKVALGARTQMLSNIGYIDPITTAWELIPFSFIIDWFVNVGDFLRSASPFISRDVVYASLVNEHEYGAAWQTLFDRLKSTSPNVWTFEMTDNTPAVGSIVYRFKERSSTQAASSVSARINLSIPKVTDIAALVWQYFNRR